MARSQRAIDPFTGQACHTDRHCVNADLQDCSAHAATVDKVPADWMTFMTSSMATCFAPIAIAVVSTFGLVLSPLPAQASSSTMYRGISALPSHRMDLVATLTTRAISPLVQQISIVETTPPEKRVTLYDIDMTKRLHLIVVDAALNIFMHVHPTLDLRGAFRAVVSVPHQGLYHLYADTAPHGFGHHVFRFDVPFGIPSLSRRSAQLEPTGRTAHVGAYTVTLDRLALRAGVAEALDVHITSQGAPAHDLHPYLGGMAHGVFINAHTLSYVHVHPLPATAMTGMTGMHAMDVTTPMTGMGDMMEMQDLPANAPVDPHMTLRVILATPGPYILWLQFRGGDHLYVSRFVVDARRT